MVFTIAIPTYNNEKTIQKTIESAILQTYSDEYQIVVLNNNSTDKTAEILQKFKDRIQIVQNVETVTMYENHNLCLKYAAGDYVIFCHSDDSLLPESLTKFYQILQARNFPTRFVLWGRSMFRDYGSNWQNSGFNLNQIASGINSFNAFYNGGLTPSGTCYSRKSFLDTGGFVKTLHKLAPSDWVTMWRLAINFFEFEMSDRIFFIREFASTASGADFNTKDILSAINDALTNLFETLDRHQRDIIISQIINSTYFNPMIFKILIEKGLISKRTGQRKAFKVLIRHPLKLRNKVLRSLLC